MAKTLTFLFILITASFLQSQCIDELWHNSSVNSIWLSCQRSASPNPEIGVSHWIRYDFTEMQSIEDVRVWNITHPIQSKSGASKIRLDISPDGLNWNQIGVYDIEEGRTDREYTGQILANIEEFQTQHVLLTIIDTHGSPACAGLAEVQFKLGEGTVATDDEYLASLVQIIPNPVDRLFTVSLDGIATSKINYQMVDMSGRLIFQDRIDAYGTKNEIKLNGGTLPDGQYTLRLDTDKGPITKKIMVVHPR